MKFASFACLLGSAVAFHVALPSARRARVAPLFEATIDAEVESSAVDVSTTLAKTELLEVAQGLNDEYGCLIIDSTAQEKLKAAVEKLETVTEVATDTQGLLGDWTLLCATASAGIEGSPLDKINGIDTTKLPFFNQGPLKEIRDTINKSLTVQQLIKSGDSETIDRVDHVLDYQPPDTLAAFLNNLPDAIKNLNINPFQISDGKFILVHKAEIETVDPEIKTKLTLESIIVNIAGTSKRLNPEGADVLGVNVPFGEIFNSGSFNTTYMDDTLRVSRSKVGIVDQLRVFVRTEPTIEVVEEIPAEEEEDDGIEAPSDVEDV